MSVWHRLGPHQSAPRDTGLALNQGDALRRWIVVVVVIALLAIPVILAFKLPREGRSVPVDDATDTDLPVVITGTPTYTP